MVSPVTVGLVAGAVALVLVLGGRWWWAIVAAVAAWVARVSVAIWIAHQVTSRPRRIDPFALREPWRFLVRDALKAQNRFRRAVDTVEAGPGRDRLSHITTKIDQGVAGCWEVAQRGQQLSDRRRAVDIERVRHVLVSPDIGPDDPRRASAELRKATYDQIRGREDDLRARMEALESRLDQAVLRASELPTEAGAPDQLEEVADEIDGIVGDLAELKLGLDAANGAGA